MHLLRRAAVRTALLQSPRYLSTCRPTGARIALPQTAQPASFRPFHQARIWRATEDKRSIGVEEASPEDATTTGETVPVEALEEAAAAEPFEREEVAEQFKEEAAVAAEAAENAAEIAEDVAVSSKDGLEAANDAARASQIAGRAAEMAGAASDASPGIAQFPSGQTAPTEDVAAAASATAQVAAEAAASAASAAAAAPQYQPQPRRPFEESQRQPYQQRTPQRADAANSSLRSSNAPSRILYVGNLFFEVTAQQLETEFSKFGQITNSRVVTDNRGLSKGFAYLEYGTQESADRAVREADQKVFQGRRMAVQYHVKREPRRFAASSGEERPVNPPSKTLFIGNMSYQMSDRDLNDLFREIRDVLDVRVAIDRRSGQPRGFAHADFVDVTAAQRAKEVLEKKVVYGRQLRVDFSSSSSSTQQIPQ